MQFERLFSVDSGSKQSFFLFGPRGTGKTTWVKKNFPEAIYLDLLDAALFRTLVATPERLKTFIQPNFRGWVVIDEVQRIPGLLNEVHRLIESEKLRFILTGSSARSLRKKVVNLLAGRALTHHFHPLTRAELGVAFSLEHSLRFGNLPLAYTSDTPAEFLQSYVETYLREEVSQEGLTRSIGSFSRFLEVASFSQGEVLNTSNVAREVQIGRKVASGYFDILEDLLIGVRIPVFDKRADRRLIAHPKFYYFDVGLYRTLRPSGPLDTEEESVGAALETLFFQEIRALNDYDHLGYTIHYWRTSTGLEVDFVLYGPKGLLAFEIKRKKSVSPKDMRGLRAFLKDYPEAKVYMVCNTDHEEYHGKITVLPIMSALDRLRGILRGEE